MNGQEKKVTEFIEKNIKKEKDKWACGMKSKYYQWEDMLNEWKAYLEGKEQGNV